MHITPHTNPTEIDSTWTEEFVCNSHCITPAALHENTHSLYAGPLYKHHDPGVAVGTTLDLRDAFTYAMLLIMIYSYMNTLGSRQASRYV